MKKLFIFLLLISSLLFAKSTKGNVERVGDYVQLSLPISAWLTTIIIGDKEGQMEFYKSFIATVATTHLLKYTIDETRPDGSNTKSFPSGHTSASFQGATFIHKRYGLKYAIVPYIGATYVGFSRVYADKHYTHDVLAGAIIGASFSWFFTKTYKFKSFYLKPIVYNSALSYNNFYGVNLNW